MKKVETLNYFKYQYECLKRAWDHARFGYSTPDYDWKHLIQTIHFKTARLEKIMNRSELMDKNDSRNKLALKSIRLSRILIEKFLKDDYTLNQDRETAGHLLFSKQVESGYFFSDKRDIIDPKVSRYLNAISQDETKKKNFLEKGLRIMVKYHKYWWD